MTGRTWRGLCWLFAGVLLSALAPSARLLAQDAARAARQKPARSAASKSRAREQKREARTQRAARRAARHAARHARETKATPTREATVHASPPVSASAREAAAAAQAAGADATIVKEGDTSVKVMTFSGLDIEGRLRSPQLVYFTQRVRAEFERPTLPHRSFLPELESTTEREPIR